MTRTSDVARFIREHLEREPALGFVYVESSHDLAEDFALIDHATGARFRVLVKEV